MTSAPAPGRPHLLQALAPRYERRSPSNQNIADIFAGHWRSKLPGDMESGGSDLFADKRPQWLARALPGGVTGRRILELGPFEAYQTYLLEQLGAGDILAVESNTINFLKCLCVKEMYGLKARFLLGDAASYVANCTDTYDIVWASGIAYHLQDPIGFMVALGRICEASYVWTHFYDWNTICQDEVQARHFDASRNIVVEAGGRSITLYARSYRIGDYERNLPLRWQGGVEDVTYWLAKDDLFFVLELAGFKNIRVAGLGQSSSLPSISVLASKT